jgi:hypothetical protein
VAGGFEVRVLRFFISDNFEGQETEIKVQVLIVASGEIGLEVRRLD